MAKREIPARAVKRNAAHEIKKGKGRARTRAGGLKIIDDPKTDERRLALQLQSMGLYACHTLGDGNCLFRALSDQLHGTPNHHARVREEVCAHLERNEGRYKAFVDVDEGGSWEGHLREMRRNGTYGGHLELSAFAHLHRRPIKVIQPGLVYIIGHEDESPSALKRRAERETRRLLLRGSQPPSTSSGSGSGSGSSGRTRSSTLTAYNPVRPSSTSTSTSTKKGKARQAHPPAPAAADEDDRMIEDDDDDDEEDIEVVEEEEEEQEEQVESEEHTGDTTEEEFGEDSPLYIIYHQWEHYSSVRNIDGPHVGPPRIRERKPTFLESPASSQETNSREDSVSTTESDLLRKSLPRTVSLRFTDRDLLKLIEVHGSWERTLEVLLDEHEHEEAEEGVGGRGGRTSPFKAAVVVQTQTGQGTQRLPPSPILIRVRRPHISAPRSHPHPHSHSPSPSPKKELVKAYREASPATSSSTATDSNHHSSGSTDAHAHPNGTPQQHPTAKVDGAPRPSTRSQDLLPRPSSALDRLTTPSSTDARSPASSSGRSKPKSRSRSPEAGASPDEGVGRRLRRRPLVPSDSDDDPAEHDHDHDHEDVDSEGSDPAASPAGFQHVNTVSADLDASNQRPNRLRSRLPLGSPASSGLGSGFATPSASGTATTTPSSSSASAAPSPIPSSPCLPGTLSGAASVGTGTGSGTGRKVLVKRDRKEERKARKRERETLARRAAAARAASAASGPETAALFKELRV